MQRSLAALRELPESTLLYPGHEYTVRNLQFAAHVEPRNAHIAALLPQAEALRAQGRPTVPTTLGQERDINPFLRWDAPDVIAHAGALGAPGRRANEVFAAVRREKDTF
jgi:hydroxyacylglutathione hydrolase